MRRFPFYAFPNSFYGPSAEPSYYRPQRSFSPAPSRPAQHPSPTARSVINVPVSDSAPSRSSSSPPQRTPLAVPLIDPSSAATRIQSHFRGFCVRRHRPLLHLRSIARALKQLEELQSELATPEFALKVRASEKVRLQFSESVMAIILRLDAIGGSLAEVRSQRKEATKMAIKLQDAIDTIMMQKDEMTPLTSTAEEDGMVPNDGGMGPSTDSVRFEQPQEPIHPREVNMVEGNASTASANDIMAVSTLQEKPIAPEDDVADKCMPNIDNDHVMDMAIENVSPLHPRENEDLDQQREAGLGCIESVPQLQPANAVDNAEQDISHVTGENAGHDGTLAAEKEVENGIDALHLETCEHYMSNDSLVAKADEDICVDDMTEAGNGFAERELESPDEPYTCMDVVEECKEGIIQDVGTPTAEEKCDYPHSSHASHRNELQGVLISHERPTEGNCLSSSTSPTLHRNGYAGHSNEGDENRSNDTNSCDELEAQASALSMADSLSGQDSAIIHQLTEDCKQLKSLVGKLLVQNKTQSKILCALGERLEMLEHQQQLNCQHNQQKMRKKRKLKKGSKRSVKCRNCE